MTTRAKPDPDEAQQDVAADPVVAVPDDVAATGVLLRVTRNAGVVVPVVTVDGDDVSTTRVFIGEGGRLPAGVPDAELNNLTALGFILPA